MAKKLAKSLTKGKKKNVTENKFLSVLNSKLNEAKDALGAEHLGGYECNILGLNDEKELEFTLKIVLGKKPNTAKPENFDSLIENGGSDSELLTYAIDWIIAQNENPQSQYYNKIDVWNIAVGGMSCGGLQTLDVAKDPRLSTVMICNSGLFKVSNASSAVPGMPMPTKDRLAEIHTPIIYILGGPEDIAYGNGMDDFSRIKHVPAFACNYPVGHGGTYGQPHGGEFVVPALNWLNWQLKGDKESAKMFQGEAGLGQREKWTVEKNELIDATKKKK